MERRISGRTGMFCLIGTPVGHSGSPAMYNYSFQKTGLDNAYLAYDIPLEKTEEAVQALRVLGCKGFNVTMPCKTKVAELVDELSDAAKLIGACNTVVVKDGKLYGNNTDGMGFVRNLKENGVDVKGKKMTIMGAGGAATAVQVQSALDGTAKISIFNRADEFYANAEHTKTKIKEMLPECDVNVYPLEDTEKLYAEIKDSDILVNATKVGMKPLDGQSLIEDTSVFRPDLVVADVVYNPKETKFVQDAKAAGCKVAVGGIGMLLWQGAAAFKLFTGEDMPTDEVYELFFK
ncbi:shikimate dehydrogenase [Anaerotignum sp.]|uniref:shikimate dehydrogenase n=1 Tax=Anaerotignum sp. TaxID=2039241 RepID=UPI0029DA4C91|nr:shikimate dehydrogenase [Anaerotignum sp.]MCI6057711.1 shikimate dehydrogenase [Clostridia bacterium]MDY3596028.1 shikimate dehydrogenase [Anaerotignum sp.]